MSQPTKEQVLAALRLNEVEVLDEAIRWELHPDGELRVLADDRVVALPRSDWTPTRMCSADAECVGRTSCPRAIGCDQ